MNRIRSSSSHPNRPWSFAVGMLAVALVLAACTSEGAAPSEDIETPSNPAVLESPATTASEVPSAEPTPEVTPTPTPEPTPVEPILKTAGKGDKIVKMTAQDAPTWARITGKGSGNFSVVTYTGAEYGDLLVNTIGSYAGRVYIAAGINRLKVTSEGSWTIDVRPITTAKHWNGAESLTGKGDDVVNLVGWPSGITTITGKSDSNFSVTAYDQDGEYLDLLVNTIGDYSGEVLLPDADPIVLVIHAEGATWSFSAPQS